MKELQLLKTLLDKHRNQNPTKKAFPKEFWPQVVELSHTIPPAKMAIALGIDLVNLKKRIKDADQSRDESSSFVQVPLTSFDNLKKQVTINLPHGITLRIEL